MERVHGGRAAEHVIDLAHQLYQAGGATPPTKARHYLKLAGLRSIEAAAAEEAVHSFERALEIEDEMSPEERAELLFHCGLARRAHGHWDEAIRDWNEALPVLEEAGEVDLVTRICRDVAHKEVWDNRPEAAKEIVARGLRATGDDASAGRCRLLSILGYAHSISTF